MRKKFRRILQTAVALISASFIPITDAWGGWYVFLNPELNPGVIGSVLHVRAVAKPGPLPTEMEVYNRGSNPYSGISFANSSRPEHRAVHDWLRARNIPTQGVMMLGYSLQERAWVGHRRIFPFWVSSTAEAVVEAKRNLQDCLLALNSGVPVPCPGELTFRPREIMPGLFYEETDPSPTYRWESINLSIGESGHSTHVPFGGRILDVDTAEFTHLTEGMLDVAIWGESQKVTSAKYSALSRAYVHSSIPSVSVSAMGSGTSGLPMSAQRIESSTTAITKKIGTNVAVKLGTEAGTTVGRNIGRQFGLPL